MRIDSTAYNGKCSCGRSHEMKTRGAVIEPGCLFDFEKYMAEFDIGGKRCALYGSNSYIASNGKHPTAEQEIVLDPNGLHANEISTAEVLRRLEPDVKVIIAVGSGTVHDIARYCAKERNIRFVSVPTAASVDGFCSTVAAMTWYGYKNTIPAVAPEIVIADTDIIKNAPPALVRSGVGDIMAKYTALADWEISHAVTGEYLCPRIYEIMRTAVEDAMASVPGILECTDDAYIKITYALIMSGIAMQMMGNSRPASGSEHHISHMTEMGPAKFEVRFPALHGEKTGVGSVLASDEYHRLAKTEDISPLLCDFAPLCADEMRDFFGDKLFAAVMSENASDCLAPVTKETLAAAWPKIREIVSRIPDAEKLDALLVSLGAKHTPEDIGISTADISTLLKYSPLVRNRLTLMRMRRMINLSKLT